MKFNLISPSIKLDKMSNNNLKNARRNQKEVNELSSSHSSRRIRFYTGKWPNKWESNNRGIKRDNRQTRSKKRSKKLLKRQILYSTGGVLVIYLLFYSRFN